jgi:hypothetical protein
VFCGKSPTRVTNVPPVQCPNNSPAPPFIHATSTCASKLSLLAMDSTFEDRIAEALLELRGPTNSVYLTQLGSVEDRNVEMAVLGRMAHYIC